MKNLSATSRTLFHKAFLLFFLPLMVSESFCQSTLPNKYDLSIKLVLFQEATGTKNYVRNDAALPEFVKFDVAMDTLDQSGFSDFVFIRLTLSAIPKDVLEKTGLFLVTNCDGYIVAIDRDGFDVFRLRGFRHNDFSSFYKSMTLKQYDRINNKTSFNRNYSVEGLDLKCLFSMANDIRSAKKTHPCLNTCGELITTH